MISHVGDNTYGQVGDGTTSDSVLPTAENGYSTTPEGNRIRPTAVKTTSVAKWKLLTAGDSHTCGIAESGDAYCWGDITMPSFWGDEIIISYESVPTTMETTAKWQLLTAGQSHTCGITYENVQPPKAQARKCSLQMPFIPVAMIV